MTVARYWLYLPFALGVGLLRAGEVRYVSADGSDSADGLTPATAWQTLFKLNADLPAGAEARLRCGDVFSGELNVKGGPDSNHVTVVSAFGRGPRPEISHYKIAKPEERVWEMVSNNVWRLNLRDSSKFSGDQSSKDFNVGFLRVTGSIHGVKRDRPEELATWLEFSCQDGYVYVWSRFCPTALSSDIRFACNGRCASPQSNTTFRNLLFRGCGGHGMQFGSENVLIEGCGFRELGGSYLDWGGAPRTRYGNGVECWTGARHVLVRSCDFADIYDVAFTIQGNSPERSWQDIRMADCTVDRCTQAFEVWVTGCKPGIGMIDCCFERNVVNGCGWSWGAGGRPSAPLLVYEMSTDTCGILVRNNVFRGSRAETLHKSGGLSELPTGYVVKDNEIHLADGATIGNIGLFGRRHWSLLREQELHSQNQIRKEGEIQDGKKSR